jgi:cytochrome c oxidase subunit 3
MATTTHEPPQVHPGRLPEDHSGNGGRNLIPSAGNLRSVQNLSEPPASTAMWVLIAGIVMTFAAFSSALIVRQGGANDWRHLVLPPILYVNSLILILSSVTLEFSRRQITSFMRRDGSATSPYPWLLGTFGLGLLFVVGQYSAWLQLRAQGVYLATSPNSSFFYLFTVLHALHVLGGLTGMAYVMLRLHQGVLRRSTLIAACRYWHFMGVLWLYLLFLLWSRI